MRWGDFFYVLKIVFNMWRIDGNSLVMEGDEKEVIYK